MADFFNNYSRGFALGQQQKQDRQNRNMLAELQQIGPQVIAGDLAATDRAFALDPDRAKAFQAEGNRQQQQLFGLAKSLKQSAANPQMQAGIYRSAVPFLKRSFGAEIPDEFDAASVMPIVDQVLAVAANAPSMGAGMGGGVQSTYVDDQGQRVAILRDGSTRILGGNDAGSNQQTLTIDVNGTPTQVTFDRRTGRYTNASLGAPQQQLQQIDGQPTYIDPSLPPQVQAAIRAGAGTNLQDGGQLQVPQGAPLVGRRKEDEAFAVANAKNAADNANFNNSLEQDRLRKEQEARIEADKAMAVQQAKSQEERAATGRAKSAALNNVKRGITRIDKALTAIEGLRGVDSGPLDQYLVARTKEGQELAAAVGAIQDSMLALTRVPGVGSQSDLEARLANLKYPDLGNYPSVNRNNYSQLKDFASDLERQFGGSDAEAAPASGPQPGTVEDGYRFRGGNPSDPNSWERI
ncbi:hypothetical protein [Stenotrophomonas maltophilia]|uniref:hypothetical protein n=1 Tax=Stenotrophomonas maltophilia TaxID=40324 RepID=UPI0015DFD04F|nr:hypothetical protein [Stenotrophomonas maltophilia]MBA0362364.1 hypothetical protein [Stenotrophomonas maltophilia]